MNAITVGALHADNLASGALPASTFDIWLNTGLCTVSSGLGPGIGNAIKPDVLAPGGRHHVRLLPAGSGHLLRPIGKNVSMLGGIVVASPAPPGAPNPDRIGRTVGTSVAAAFLTGLAARVHEQLEAVYDDFLNISGPQRAALLKALLVHCARWTSARDLIVDVLGPPGGKNHVRQKDNVRRYLGYGAVDPAIVLGCATDRATLWGFGLLQRDQANTFVVPLPAAMSGKAQLHELAATIAWFAPPRVGSASYRGVRLKLLDPSQAAAAFAVKAANVQQPDINQSHRGTVIHRRWAGDRAAALGDAANFTLTIQREPDQIDDPTPYAMITTVTMPGIAEVYTQVRDRVGIKPKVPIGV